jgi:hypothetical protein
VEVYDICLLEELGDLRRRARRAVALHRPVANGGLTRSFGSFSQAIDEIVDVRVWSGIHFRAADEQGARIARQVAKWRERHYFRAVRPGDGDD